MDKLLLISFGLHVRVYVRGQFVSTISFSSQIRGSNWEKSNRGLGCLSSQSSSSIAKNCLAGADSLGLRYDHNSKKKKRWREKKNEER